MDAIHLIFRSIQPKKGDELFVNYVSAVQNKQIFPPIQVGEVLKNQRFIYLVVFLLKNEIRFPSLLLLNAIHFIRRFAIDIKRKEKVILLLSKTS